MASERAMKAAEALYGNRSKMDLEALADLIETAAGLPALEAKAARCEELAEQFSKAYHDACLKGGTPK